MGRRRRGTRKEQEIAEEEGPNFKREEVMEGEIERKEEQREMKKKIIVKKQQRRNSRCRKIWKKRKIMPMKIREKKYRMRSKKRRRRGEEGKKR